MRYLYLLFFCFFSLQSYFVFANEPPPSPTCSGRSVQSACTDMSKITGSSLSYFNNLCYNQPNKHQAFEANPACTGAGTTAIVCYSQCTCPDGFDFKTELNPVTGVKSSGCFPSNGGDGGTGGEECPNGVNPETGLCNDDDSCPEGRPKVNGMCPVCPEGYNEDGTCHYPSSEPASSAPNSSSPDTGSSGSAGSAGSAGGGGGDDGGGSPGGGGGDGGNGGNNGGGSGSASSASSASGANNSWNPYSGYGNWIPVDADSNCPNKYKDSSGQWWCAGNGLSTASAGSAASAASAANECDNTSSDYFSCINQKSVTGGAGWNPHQSYGGWLPVSPDSPCVNKYQDANGDWWCAAPSGGGGGGTPASSAGSSGSSGSSGSEGSASSGGSASSVSSVSSSASSCSAASAPNGSSASNPCSGGGNGSASSSGSLSSLGEKGEFDGEDSGKKLEDLEEELHNKIDDIKQDIKNEFTSSIRGSGSIEDFCKDIRGKEVCFGMKKFEEWLDPISSAIFLVACVISFSIVLSGRN